MLRFEGLPKRRPLPGVEDAFLCTFVGEGFSLPLPERLRVTRSRSSYEMPGEPWHGQRTYRCLEKRDAPLRSPPVLCFRPGELASSLPLRQLELERNADQGSRGEA